MPRYSFIVPAYNAQSTIQDCIHSIMAQTCADWDCIIVDDGSADATLAICQRLATHDDRFRVYHNAHGGVATARNVGIQHASGEWLVFVDADDRVAPDYLSLLMSGHDTDLVITSHRNVTAHHVQALPLVPADVCLTSHAIPPFLAAHLHHLPLVTVWAKAFRRSLIVQHDLRFQSGLWLAEDCAFLFAYLQHISSCMVLSATPYDYRVSTNAYGYSMPCPQVLHHLTALQSSYHDLCQRWGILSPSYNTFHAHSFLRSYCRHLHRHHLWLSEPYPHLRSVMCHPFVVSGLFDGSRSRLLSVRQALAFTFSISRSLHLLRPYLYILSRCYTR